MRMRRRTLLRLSASSTVALSLPLFASREALACDQDTRYEGLDPSSGLWLVLRASNERAHRFDGSFWSPQLGTLTLEQDGREVRGRFHYERGSARVAGALEGRVRGNLLRFSWREAHRSRGSERRVRGEGLLLYDPPQGDQTRARLFGHRHHRLLDETERHGVFQLVSRDAGPILATRLTQGAS